MTLGNIPSLGVRSLAVTCDLCHHEAVLSAEHWGDAVLVRSRNPDDQKSNRGKFPGEWGSQGFENMIQAGDDNWHP